MTMAGSTECDSGDRSAHRGADYRVFGADTPHNTPVVCVNEPHYQEWLKDEARKAATEAKCRARALLPSFSLLCPAKEGSGSCGSSLVKRTEPEQPVR